VYEHLAQSNVAALQAARFDRIVTTDPHSLNTIRNEYPQFGGSWQIVHYTTLLLELLHQGRLRFEPRLQWRATYHDPCHLGRFNKEFDAPRQLLQATGCELVEMARSRDNSFLLRSRRRPDLDAGPGRQGKAGADPDSRGGADRGAGAVRGGLPEGSDDVRGMRSRRPVTKGASW